jgi:hypothetical protein
MIFAFGGTTSLVLQREAIHAKIHSEILQVL